MADRPPCPNLVLDERGNSYPCAKREHAVGVCVAVIGEGPGARVVWNGDDKREIGMHREWKDAPDIAEAEEVQPFVAKRAKPSPAQRDEARFKGFTGDACGTCGSLALVPNGTCTKCTVCGSTSGCS